MRPALALFDAWEIHNLRGEWTEWIGEGPLSVFFDKTWSRATAQVFLGFEDGERPPEIAIDRLRGFYGHTRCIPVFHFRDGRILLIDSDEPARMIFRRIEGFSRMPMRGRRRSQTLRLYFDFCGCDSRGEPFAPEDREIWEGTTTEELFFVDEDSEEEDSEEGEGNL